MIDVVAALRLPFQVVFHEGAKPRGVWA